MSNRLPLCFVLLPFGKKPGPGGALIDFDAVYHELIAPAVEQAGLEPLRADLEKSDRSVARLVDGFAGIQRLKTDVFRDRVDYSHQLKARLRDARQLGPDAAHLGGPARRLGPRHAPGAGGSGARRRHRNECARKRAGRRPIKVGAGIDGQKPAAHPAVPREAGRAACLGRRAGAGADLGTKTQRPEPPALVRRALQFGVCVRPVAR